MEMLNPNTPLIIRLFFFKVALLLEFGILKDWEGESKFQDYVLNK